MLEYNIILPFLSLAKQTSHPTDILLGAVGEMGENLWLNEMSSVCHIHYWKLTGEGAGDVHINEQFSLNRNEILIK